MKKAYQYIRISTKDQSNWSIDGQIETNERYASNNDIKIVKTFIDNGQSAKTFDRIEWKKIARQLEINKKDIDFLIVTKYDRLIRNVSEGLSMLDTIERKWDIKVISVMENIGIPVHSPMFFKFRADMFVNADFELRVIRERTKFGINNALMSGRYLGYAMYGYVNKRDLQNRPILAIHPEKAAIVKGIFQDYANGMSMIQTKRRAIEKGFSLKGNGVIRRVLTNRIYEGYVYVRAYKDNPECYVKGVHKPIVSHKLFKKANDRLSKNKTSSKEKISNNLFLRGHLVCGVCGQRMTGAKSKGRKKFYYYYRCDHCDKGRSYQNDKVHAELDDLLDSISFNKGKADKFIRLTKEALKKDIKERQSKKPVIMKKIYKLEKTLESLELKFINDEISREVYSKWSEKYTEEMQELRMQVKDLNQKAEVYFQRLNKVIPLMKSLKFVFSRLNYNDTMVFLDLLFDKQLILSDYKLEPKYLIELFKKDICKPLIMNDVLGGIGKKNGKLCEKDAKFPFGSGGRT